MPKKPKRLAHLLISLGRLPCTLKLPSPKKYEPLPPGRPLLRRKNRKRLGRLPYTGDDDDDRLGIVFGRAEDANEPPTERLTPANDSNDLDMGGVASLGHATTDRVPLGSPDTEPLVELPGSPWVAPDARPSQDGLGASTSSTSQPSPTRILSKSIPTAPLDILDSASRTPGDTTPRSATLREVSTMLDALDRRNDRLLIDLEMQKSLIGALKNLIQSV